MKRIKTMRKMKVLIWTVFSLLLLMTHVHAQEGARKINGSVKDDSGNPIPGVTVSVKGTQVVAVTNALGVFTLQCG